jgi:EAL domain-containing protein (putative c-di-GMP-specific phosphodiesterase class I)
MSADRQIPARQPKAPAAAPAAGTPPMLGNEEMLLAYVEQLTDARKGQRAMIVHLSRLQGSKPRDKNLQIVAAVLREVTDQFAGRLFVLDNGDVVVVCKGITRRAIDETIEVLRYLFNDDPMTRAGTEQADFCAVFDLEVGYIDFLFALDEIREAARRISSAAGQRRHLDPTSIDPVHAGNLIKALQRVEFAGMLRRQTVWEMARATAPRPRFEEIFVSMDRLQKAIGPAFDLAKDRQLFLYVKRWLDQHVMATVVRHQSNVSLPLGFSLGLATLLSPEFDDFDKRSAIARERIVLELSLAELLRAPSAFRQVADRLKQRGYRLCIDDVSHQILPCLNLRPLAADYMKVVWDDTLLHLGEESLREFCEAVAAYGGERVILSHCGRRQAIRVGHAMGVRLFQGWQMDQANQ